MVEGPNHVGLLSWLREDTKLSGSRDSWQPTLGPGEAEGWAVSVTRPLLCDPPNCSSSNSSTLQLSPLHL